MSDVDIAWAAGLFEGEGCISLRSRPQHRIYFEARLMVDMTDEDVVRRFAAIVGAGTVRGPYMKAGGRKPVWLWQTAERAEVQRILTLFWPFLGARRRGKASAVLELPPTHPRVRLEVLGLVG